MCTDCKMSSQRHTSEIEDGSEWARLNLSSVTEQSTLDDFLATAELAGTEFTAGWYCRTRECIIQRVWIYCFHRAKLLVRTCVRTVYVRTLAYSRNSCWLKSFKVILFILSYIILLLLLLLLKSRLQYTESFMRMAISTTKKVVCR